jgi:transposase
MSNVRHIGLDVHKEFVVMALAQGREPAEVLQRIECSPPRVLAALRRLGPLSALRVCYEAGPTGYGLQRFLAGHGVDCQVVAPALVPQAQGSRIKTDRRDACRLAHFLRSGDLVGVWVPDEQTEALRDLERARDDARLAERRIKQQLLKFLLRHGRVFTTGKELWTKTHWDWIRVQRFDQEAQQRVLADAVQCAAAAQERIARLDQDLADCLAGWRLAPLVRNLQAFKGVRLLTAVGLAAEIGDFQRFPTAGKFMAFVGLVPSEASSGQSRRQGGITKAGNAHVRRLLIEAAWQYVGAGATAGPTLARRRENVPAEIVTIADRALRRLRKKAYAMSLRKKSGTKIVTAVARELAGFLWAAARATKLDR